MRPLHFRFASAGGKTGMTKFLRKERRLLEGWRSKRDITAKRWRAGVRITRSGATRAPRPDLRRRLMSTSLQEAAACTTLSATEFEQRYNSHALRRGTEVRDFISYRAAVREVRINFIDPADIRPSRPKERAGTTSKFWVPASRSSSTAFTPSQKPYRGTPTAVRRMSRAAIYLRPRNRDARAG